MIKKHPILVAPSQSFLKMCLLQTAIAILIGLTTFSLSAEPVPIPAPPAVGAKAYILKDFNSNKVIAEHNANSRIEPASITKIMTAYVVFQEIAIGRLSLDDTANISVKAWHNPGVSGWTKGSRMFAEVDSEVEVTDLLRGLIIQSGNDAAIALAERVAGSEKAFIELMNVTAQKLNLTNTQYKNATGWPTPGHYTSARDVALLSRALIKDFPDLYSLYSEKSFTYNNIAQSNRNTLLWKDETVDGIKTGYTSSAGYCLAASAERSGMRLISVVMGAPSTSARIKYSQGLLSYGFRYFQTHQLFSGSKALKKVRVWKGGEDFLGVGTVKDLYITIPRGQYNNLKPVMNIRKIINAPVKKGEMVGTVDIFLDEQIIKQKTLVALNSIERGNIFQRIADQITFLLQ